MKPKYDYSKENLEKLAKESTSVSEMYYKMSGRWEPHKVLKKYIKLYNIDISHFKIFRLKTNLDNSDGPKTELQQRIVKLRKENKSFREISKILKCSIQTVSRTLRENTRERDKIRRLNDDPKDWHKTKWKSRLGTNINSFKRRSKGNKNFGIKEVLEKYNNQTKIQCYLTGDLIDITKDTYAIDHIIPVCKGGLSNLDNLAITTYLANISKSTMTEEEYIEHCKKVLIYHGYKVEKNI